MKCKYLLTSLLIILLSVGCNVKNQPTNIATAENVEKTEEKTTDIDRSVSQLELKTEALLIENAELKERINELEDVVSSEKEIEELNKKTNMKYKFLIDAVSASNEIDNSMVSEVEAINGIHIGDSMSDVLKNLGDNFELYLSDDGFDPVVSYNGISISIHEYYYTVTEIYVNSTGFVTKEGVQVGDNAKEVIKLYRENYDMNSDEKLYEEYPELLFDLGRNFILQFAIDTDELTDESIITRITLRNITYGEY